MQFTTGNFTLIACLRFLFPAPVRDLFLCDGSVEVCPFSFVVGSRDAQCNATASACHARSLDSLRWISLVAFDVVIPMVPSKGIPFLILMAVTVQHSYSEFTDWAPCSENQKT